MLATYLKDFAKDSKHGLLTDVMKVVWGLNILPALSIFPPSKFNIIFSRVIVAFVGSSITIPSVVLVVMFSSSMSGTCFRK